MSNLGGGDQLARGARSAQFAGGVGTISQFEDDLIFRKEIVAEKYGLTEEQIAGFELQRNSGEKLPDLPTKEEREELSKLSAFSVTDKRRSYLEDTHPLAAESKAVAQTRQYSEKTYSSPKCILDRILIKRVSDDPNLETLSDGTVRDKRTGFIIPPQYRQHSNVGIVLAIGDFVIMGGVKTTLSDFVNPGDKVTYGDYNSEVFPMPASKVKELCDAVQIDFVDDVESVRIVRVQDVRMIEHPVKPEENDGGF